MSITTLDGLVAAIAASQDIVIQKANVTSVAGNWYSFWAATGNPGAGSLTIGNTTAGIVPTDATAGAPTINAFTGANAGYLCSFGLTASVTGCFVLHDRVWHMGSVVATSLATTTLSGQPSFSGRVPGSNWGEVEAWLEINAAVSATATTASISYQDGTNAAQTATLDANLSGAPSARMLPFRLANGTGIQKVNSLTIGGTVASTGSVNVVLLRRLAQMNVPSANIGEARQDFFRLGGQAVYADSCLALMMLATGTSSGPVYCDFQIGNG